MSCLAWNCRGLGNLRTVRALKKLLFDKDPGCVFLSETRKKDSEMNYFRNMHGYTNVFAVSCIGEGRRRAGVQALLWKHDIEVDIKSFSKNHIDFFISLEEGEEKWRCTGVYGYSDTQSKHKTCELIEQLAGMGNTDKWMLMGDVAEFNLISLFKDTLQNLNLVDLGFKGENFTWHNNQNGVKNIKERLDRMVASQNWLFSYPNATITHLTRHTSDHMPLLLRLAPRKSKMKHNKKKIIRFEECWFRDENFKELVVKAWENQDTNLNRKITGCVEALARWEDDRFGEVPKKIRSIQKKLDDLNRKSTLEDVVTEIRRQEARLDDLLESEEMWWAQHSRASWLRHCDKNTKFFHQKASQRKHRNWVDTICDEHGECFTDEDDIARVLTNFFQTLFMTSNPERIAEAVEVVRNRPSRDMCGILDEKFTEDEVVTAVRNLKPHAAPGPDGIPAIFFQQFWSIVG